MADRHYSNISPPVALTADIDTDDTTIPVGSTADYPTAPFAIAINRSTANEEVILVQDKDATNFLNCVRGYDGTNARAASETDPVEHVVIALDFREAREHIEGDLTLHSSGAADEGFVPKADGEGGISWEQEGGNINEWYGNGSDGALTVGSGQTVSVNQPRRYTNLTVASGGILVVNAPVFVQGTLTLNGRIQTARGGNADGKDGRNNTSGSGPTTRPGRGGRWEESARWFLGGGLCPTPWAEGGDTTDPYYLSLFEAMLASRPGPSGIGGFGGASANPAGGIPGAGGAGLLGGSGGAGGNGTLGGSGGAGGAVSDRLRRHLALNPTLLLSPGIRALAGGGGGGGGYGGDPNGSNGGTGGGGGGGGGGVILVFANAVVGTGFFDASGFDGGDGGDSPNAGGIYGGCGGGGGGGGVVYVVTETPNIPNGLTADVTGGQGGEAGREINNAVMGAPGSDGNAGWAAWVNPTNPEGFQSIPAS